MARLAKEATTVRRVLEPLFHSFDADNHWSPEKGVAFSVLVYFQSLLEESGYTWILNALFFLQNFIFLINHLYIIDIFHICCKTPGDNSHLFLSVLVKHLDHKNVVKQPLVQINIVNVTTQLAKNAKQQASVAIIGAISDLIKHLRKCLQNLAEVSSPRDATDKWHTDLHLALEKCISQLSIKVCNCFAIVFQINVKSQGLRSISRPPRLMKQRLLVRISPLPFPWVHYL